MDNQKMNNNRPDQDPEGGNNKKDDMNKKSLLVMVVLAIAVMIIAQMLSGKIASASQKEVTYTEFMQDVKDGKVTKVEHHNGNFHKAWLPKASEENEHADVVITTPEGTDILCRQIAGAVARRIVTYAKEGEDCYIDEHLGFIKLGSRVDVFLPIDSEVCVKMGQSTTGDQTVLAKLP